MAEKLGFDEKIANLFAYEQALQELPPEPEEGFVVPGLVDETAWYLREDPQRIRQSESLEEALKGVGFVLGGHARVEYGAQGRDFASRELQSDTAEGRMARSRVLAVMTRPTSFEEIDEGAVAINNFLGRMLDGAQVEIAPFGNRYGNAHQRHTVDASRPVFGVFGAEFYHRTLNIQYDTPRTQLLIPVPPVLAVPLHYVVSGEGVSLSTC